jgi:hypothetical protein
MTQATLAASAADIDSDPDVLPWKARPAYVAVAELLSDYRASNLRLGRAKCPVTDYLAAHVDDDILEVEAYIYAHADWGPIVLTESMHLTLQHNDPATPEGAARAAWAQHYLMLQLVRLHPFERARGPFCAMLKHPEMTFVSPKAAYVALAYLNAGHPNPRKFLEKAEVSARHFPAVDLTLFGAPDFD